MEPAITLFGLEMNPPRSFSVFGFPIYFYGIIIAAGFGLAVLYLLKRRGDFGLTQDNVLDIFLCAILGGLVGARLYFVIFNASDYFGAGKWLNIFKVREGGLAVYGGIIGGSIAAVLYARRKKLKIPPMLDAGGLGLLIGQAIGRWGNFINREAYGSVTDLPWAMELTFPSGAVLSVHPTFLYESLWNAIGFVLLHIFSKKRKQYDGQIFLLYMLWYGLGRVWIEGLRTDSLYLGGTSLRISQLVAAACAGASAGILCYQRAKRKKAAPGVTIDDQN